MGKESNCPFCKELAKAKADADYYRRSERYTEKYTAALVKESYCDGNFTGRLTHYGQVLNFCPTCGSPISENANNHSSAESEKTEDSGGGG